MSHGGRGIALPMNSGIGPGGCGPLLLMVQDYHISGKPNRVIHYRLLLMIFHWSHPTVVTVQINPCYGREDSYCFRCQSVHCVPAGLDLSPDMIGSSNGRGETKSTYFGDRVSGCKVTYANHEDDEVWLKFRYHPRGK